MRVGVWLGVADGVRVAVRVDVKVGVLVGVRVDVAVDVRVAVLVAGMLMVRLPLPGATGTGEGPLCAWLTVTVRGKLPAAASPRTSKRHSAIGPLPVGTTVPPERSK